MSNQGVDRVILEAWLSARSIARGLPAPVPDYGGFRVDTKSDFEIARWVFPETGHGIEELARTLSKPGYFLKLCGAADQLRAALPMGWELHAARYFMRATGRPTPRCLPDGYRIETDRRGMVLKARILSEAGSLAASGYSAETQDALVYDRIVTEPDHRRKGLGHALISALHAARRHRGPELLVATEDGRALYSALGWETISPYSTASIRAP